MVKIFRNSLYPLHFINIASVVFVSVCKHLAKVSLLYITFIVKTLRFIYYVKQLIPQAGPFFGPRGII